MLGEYAREPVKIVVHPLFAPAYASFFVEGIDRVWGRGAISYSRRDFPDLDPASRLLVMTLHASGRTLRLCIAPDDMAGMDDAALEWCDTYAKVNVDWAQVPRDREKVVPVGPTFGVRAWSAWESAADWCRIHLAAPMQRAPVGGRGFRAQLRDRLPEPEYSPKPSVDDYVFFMAWPWKNHAEVNPPRAEFVRQCRAAPGVEFEGGFAPRKRNDMPELDGLFAERRYPLSEYLEKTRRSALVFNTPAVHNCLGWKLGEFLALGKAIVSLPLTREMPAPLEDGTHLHLVDGSPASLANAIGRITEDAVYRRCLEQNARAYYDEWMRPDRLMRRLAAGL